MNIQERAEAFYRLTRDRDDVVSLRLCGIVLDVKASEGREINDKGFRAQVRYLLSAGFGEQEVGRVLDNAEEA